MTRLTQGAATTYRDCAALNTYTIVEATEACKAHTGDAHGGQLLGVLLRRLQQHHAICSNLSTNCGCFVFSGGCTNSGGAPAGALRRRGARGLRRRTAPSVRTPPVRWALSESRTREPLPRHSGVAVN